MKIGEYRRDGYLAYKEFLLIKKNRLGYFVPDNLNEKSDSLDRGEYGRPQKVVDGVVRVLASNPKDYTGPGTNTYIVGDETIWIIDPGPHDLNHANTILDVVDGRNVEGILVTHTHLDHSPAANLLKKQTDAKVYGFGALSKDILALTDEEVDTDFEPDVTLAHGTSIGQGAWKVSALYTPGHFPNHMCYYLPHQQMLFSGDHVMGWSTTVIMPPLGNLAEYMDSLDILTECNAHLMLPSHGDVVTEPNLRIEEIRRHRMMRHEQVKSCIERGVKDPADIVGQIYEGLSPCLLKAAQGSVMAHLELLFELGSSQEGERSWSGQMATL